MAQDNHPDDVQTQIIEALERVPEPREPALSDGTLHGMIRHPYAEFTREDVREVAEDLVEQGILREVGEKGEGRRYRLAREY